MTYTLFNLTYAVARELGIVKGPHLATGGSTTTIADTVNRTEADAYWTKGLAWILRDAGGAGASPEGKSRVISNFVNTTATITLQSTVTDAVASGDYYAVAKKSVSQATLVQKINTALQEMGPIPIVDTTTITTAANQTEYNLPVAANRDLRYVGIQTVKDSDDNQWLELHNWIVQHTTTGTASKLVLASQPDSGYAIKLVYVDYHPAMYVDTDKLSETVPIERAVWPAVLACFQYLKQTKHVSDYDQDIDAWTDKVASLTQLHPIIAPRKPGRVFSVDNVYPSKNNYPGDRNKITW